MSLVVLTLKTTNLKIKKIKYRCAEFEKKKHSTPESPTELSVVELDCEECRHQVMRRRKNVWREKKKKRFLVLWH